MEQMEDYLKIISTADYPYFKKQAKELCGWSNSQWNFRRSGRTKLTHAERIVLDGIAANFKPLKNEQ